jgi:hypothetical protein
MTIAAALVASLLAGALAISLGIPGAGTITASAPVEPPVRTIERTVTIHRRAGEPRISITPTDGVASTGMFQDDDDHEDDDHEDDGAEAPDDEEADDDD